MNKGQLVERVASEGRITKKAADAAVNALFGKEGSNGVIADTVASGDRVEIVGFGSFDKAPRTARMGRNPQTGAEVPIPATHVPKFKPGKKFKEAVK